MHHVSNGKIAWRKLTRCTNIQGDMTLRDRGYAQNRSMWFEKKRLAQVKGACYHALSAVKNIPGSEEETLLLLIKSMPLERQDRLRKKARVADPRIATGLAARATHLLQAVVSQRTGIRQRTRQPVLINASI